MKHSILVIAAIGMLAVGANAVALNPTTPSTDATTGCYQISTADELAGFAQNVVNAGTKNACAVLTNDIAVNESAVLDENGRLITGADGTRFYYDEIYRWDGFSMEGFTGSFDGKGFTISSMYAVTALFKSVGDNAKLNDIHIADTYVYESMGKIAAGLVDEVVGSNVEITNCSFRGTIVSEEGSYIGGLVGKVTSGSVAFSKDTVEGRILSANVDISVESKNLATETLKFGSKMGALVGGVESGATVVISNSAATNVTISAAAGDNTSDVGGLVGYDANGEGVTLSNATCTNTSGCVNGNTLATENALLSGVSLTYNGSKLVAIIDSSITATEFAIPNDITVDSVVLLRKFDTGVYSTIMLPFAIDLANVTGIDTIAKFTDVVLNESTNKYESVNGVRVTTALSAYTPYFLITNETSLTFSGSVTLKQSGLVSTETTNNHWSFIGTTEYKQWVTDGTYDDEIGYVYGFAGENRVVNGKTVNVGTFTKAASGASIRPLRAYLKYTGSPAQMPLFAAGTSSSSESASSDDLPQIMLLNLTGEESSSSATEESSSSVSSSSITPTLASNIAKATDGCYLITSAADLYGFAQNVVGNTASSGNKAACGRVTATSTIVASDEWKPMIGFAGYFDGGNVTISNLNYSGSANKVGLFGSVESGAIIRNVKLTDVSIVAGDSVGGIVGAVLGTDVIIDSCNVSGNINGTYDAGGIVGNVVDYAQLTLANSYNTATVSGESNQAQSGLIGYVYCGATVNLINSYNSGEGLSFNLLMYMPSICSGNPSTISATSVGCVYASSQGQKCQISGVDDGITASTSTTDISDAYTTNLNNSSVQSQVASAYANSSYAVGKMLALKMNSSDGISGVTISYTDDGVTAAISNSATSLVIPQDITVNKVTFDRTFTKDAYSTIMLPFDIALSNVTGISEIATFTRVNLSEDKKTYESVTGTKVTPDGTLSAYTPYFLLPSVSSTLTFSGSVTLKTNDLTNATVTSNGWSFIGTTEKKTWTADNIGSDYGFAGQEKGDITIGKFVKAASGASIRPMRAYLTYVGQNAQGMPALFAASATETASIAELPETMKVILVDPTDTSSVIDLGDITPIQTRMLPTNIVKPNRWHDAMGRSLKTPKAKGIYLNDRTPVIVK